MPIIDIQRRLTQIGVIRLGRQVPMNGTNRRGEQKMRAEKLDRFRVTSPSQTLIEAVATTYGGTVAPWAGPSGPEFEVITNVTEFAVLIPQQVIDPNYETWGPGFRSRLCDGAVERMRNQPCLCKWGADSHVHEFVRGVCGCGVKRECKPTIRASVMLREIPSIGTFKIESHGVNAVASGLSSMAETIQNTPLPLPGRLTMELVDKKELANAGTDSEKLESRKFWVPKLVIDWLTPGQAYGGQIEAAARAALSGTQVAIGGQEQRPALAAAPAAVEPERPAVPRPEIDWAARIGAATTTNDINKLMVLMRTAGVRDKALVDAWTAKRDAIDAASKPAETPPAATVVEPVDAEVEPDRDEVWTAILRAAQPLGWNMPTVEEKYRAHMHHDPSDDAATGWKLTEFLTAVRAGQVK